jgi:hypothetical protein
MILFYIVYSAYKEEFIFPPASDINESEEILGHIRFTSKDEPPTNRMYQPDHRTIPSQTIEAAQGELRGRMLSEFAQAHQRVSSEAKVWQWVNFFLNREFDSVFTSYLVNDLRPRARDISPRIELTYADTYIVVNSIQYDLLHDVLAFNVTEAGVMVNVSIDNYSLGTVMAVLVTGSIRLEQGSRLTSNLQVSVYQGERDQPRLAQILQTELARKIETVSINQHLPILNLIRNNP